MLGLTRLTVYPGSIALFDQRGDLAPTGPTVDLGLTLPGDFLPTRSRLITRGGTIRPDSQSLRNKMSRDQPAGSSDTTPTFHRASLALPGSRNSV